MNFLCYGRLALGVALPTMAVYFTPKDKDQKDRLPKTPQNTHSSC